MTVTSSSGAGVAGGLAALAPDEAPKGRVDQRKRRSIWQRLGPLPWIGPAVVLVLGVVVWPAIEMVWTSFRRMSFIGLDNGSAGLLNYRTLFSNPVLGSIVVRTVIWVVVVVVVTVLVSLVLAQLLNARFPGRRMVRWALIVPWAASVVMSAMIWKWMLDYFHGIVNTVLLDLGIINHAKSWLGTPGDALWWMIGVAVFVSIPFTTYAILAGLQSIPAEVYEAAAMDGATKWRTYTAVTLPLLRPAILVGSVVNLINVFNSFPIIWVMTNGGPGNQTDTTTTFMYKLAFSSQEIGPSAAMAVVNFAIVLVMVGLYLRAVGWGRRGVGGS